MCAYCFEPFRRSSSAPGRTEAGSDGARTQLARRLDARSAVKRRLSASKRWIAGVVDAVTAPLWAARRFAHGNHRASLDPATVRRILVVELWGIGDLVLAIPAIEALRRAFPRASLTLLAKPHAMPLFEGRGLVDEIIAYDFPWTAAESKYQPGHYDVPGLVGLMRTLRRRRFDLVLDARMDVRSNVLTFLTGSRRRIGIAHGGGQHLLTDAVPPGDEARHRVDDWLALTENVGARPIRDRPQIRVRPDERAAAKATLAAAGVRPDDLVIGLLPGGSSAHKRWPASSYAALADALAERHRARIVVFCDPDRVGLDLPARTPVISVQSDLKLLLPLLAECDLAIGNDSGPMHIAAAVGVPVVVIFGSGRPAWFAPRGPEHRVVAPAELESRPSLDDHILTRPSSIAEIAVDEVLAAVDSSLSACKGSDSIGIEPNLVVSAGGLAPSARRRGAAS
jgi:ADP-heptose:LPS heptosyltransferase